jgi:hypothetical protein
VPMITTQLSAPRATSKGGVPAEPSIRRRTPPSGGPSEQPSFSLPSFLSIASRSGPCRSVRKVMDGTSVRFERSSQGRNQKSGEFRPNAVPLGSGYSGKVVDAGHCKEKSSFRRCLRTATSLTRSLLATSE